MRVRKDNIVASESNDDDGGDDDDNSVLSQAMGATNACEGTSFHARLVGNPKHHILRMSGDDGGRCCNFHHSYGDHDP